MELIYENCVLTRTQQFDCYRSYVETINKAYWLTEHLRGLNAAFFFVVLFSLLFCFLLSSPMCLLCECARTYACSRLFFFSFVHLYAKSLPSWCFFRGIVWCLRRSEKGPFLQLPNLCALLEWQTSVYVNAYMHVSFIRRQCRVWRAFDSMHFYASNYVCVCIHSRCVCVGKKSRISDWFFIFINSNQCALISNWTNKRQTVQETQKGMRGKSTQWQEKINKYYHHHTFTI